MKETRGSTVTCREAFLAPAHKSVTKRKLVAIIAAFFAAFSISAHAQAGKVTVAQPVSGAGEVESAYLAFSQGSRMLGVVPGLAAPGDTPGQILIVGSLDASGVSSDETLSVLAVAAMKDGSVLSSTRALPPLAPGAEPLLDASALRAQAAKLRAEREARSNRPGVTLQQVNEQASELLKFERVIGGDELPRDIEAHRRRLQELKALLRERMEAIKTQPVPIAFKKRESEISEQLNALTLAIKAEEARRRESGSVEVPVSPELRAKLELIEATRGEQIDLLRKELAQLRKERESQRSSR